HDRPVIHRVTACLPCRAVRGGGRKETIMRNIVKVIVPLVALVLFGAVSQRAIADDPAKTTGGIKGTVVDQDGKPAASMSVQLRKPRAPGRGPATQPAVPKLAAPEDQPKPGEGPGAPPTPGRGRNMAPPIKSATTDAEGKFEMADIPPGDYVLVAGQRGQ